MISFPLILTRPLIIFDLETTGVSPEADRIIDFAAIKIYPGDKQQEDYFRRYDPGIPIPAEATAVHGITDAHVVDKNRFDATEAEALIHLFKDCDVAGFNVSFDIAFLKKSFARASFSLFADEWRPRVIDAFKIFTMFERRTLGAAVKFYLNEDLLDAHNALVDTLATKRVLLAQLERYTTLPRTVDELHALLTKPPVGFLDAEKKLKWVNRDACIAFGKHNNKPLKSVEKPYLQWMLTGEFSDTVKDVIREALKGNFPIYEASTDV